MNGQVPQIFPRGTVLWVEISNHFPCYVLQQCPDAVKPSNTAVRNGPLQVCAGCMKAPRVGAAGKEWVSTALSRPNQVALTIHAQRHRLLSHIVAAPEERHLGKVIFKEGVLRDR